MTTSTSPSASLDGVDLARGHAGHPHPVARAQAGAVGEPGAERVAVGEDAGVQDQDGGDGDGDQDEATTPMISGFRSVKDFIRPLPS